MPKGRPRHEECACPGCADKGLHWERHSKDGFGLVRCDCGQWVFHGGYWAHRGRCINNSSRPSGCKNEGAT